MLAHSEADNQATVITRLGFKKYVQLMDEAKKYARKANKRPLNEEEREIFLQIPLLLRKKAIEEVSLENL